MTLTRGADGTYRPDAQGNAHFTTDENGQARILGLPQGSYAIAESVHEEYAALDASPRFELTVQADKRLLAAFAGQDGAWKTALEEKSGGTILLEESEMGFGQYAMEKRKKK